VNEVTNGLIGSNATLAVIPAGTGNDFIRMTQIPADPLQAVSLLLNGQERQIDLGCVAKDRYFVNGIGIGIDAQVGRDVLQMEHLKGARAYLYAAVCEVFRFKAFSVVLTGKDWAEELRCISLGLANGKFCGGGFKLAPRAKLDDGLIDISAIEDFPKLERLVRLPQARRGSHLKLRKVHYHQDRAVTISSKEKLIAHIDGEPYQLPTGAFEVTAVPRALRVLVPS
jgi:YegS/Rv2252/BmrU family lipid kinase